MVSDFFDGANQMRKLFDERLGSVQTITRERFIWDYWHVPNQYTYIRTFAELVFPATLFASFVRRLRAWGKHHLGCDQISVPWLSYYVDGCKQELHADVAHGPWAYVFSLTDWENRVFSGGETMLLKPECLDFWRYFEYSKERPDSVFALIPPRFNQLTIFDARVPHGVRIVSGTSDPLKSRVVLHGWFRYPSYIASEELEGKLDTLALDSALKSLEALLGRFETVAGFVTARLELNTNGTVEDVRILSDTLVSTAGQPELLTTVLTSIKEFWAEWTFPEMRANGWITVPVKLPISNPKTP